MKTPQMGSKLGFLSFVGNGSMTFSNFLDDVEIARNIFLFWETNLFSLDLQRY